MILRPFQSRAIGMAREEVRRGRRAPLIVAPTGSGKTCMAASIVHGHLIAGPGDRSVVWFAHRRELVKQAADTLESFGLAVGYDGLNANAPVQVVSVQAALARGEAPPGTLAIFDEAHHFVADEWGAIPKLYENAIRVGLTATPERADGRGLGGLFNSLIIAAQIKELIGLGFLTSCDALAPKRVLDKSIALAPADAYAKHAAGTSCVVFAGNVGAANEYQAQFTAIGVRSEVITGTTPTPDRDYLLGLFASGKIPVLINVYVLTEGWDAPRAKTCILACKIGSAGGYLQRVGRILRPWENKRALLIDLFGTSLEAYGAPDEDRVFDLEGIGIRRKRDAVDEFCSVHQVPRVDGVCPECGERSPREMGAPGIAGVELDKWAGFQKMPTDKRVTMLAGFYRKARDNGWKSGAAAYRYKAIFKHWPSAEVIAAAKRAVEL